MKNTRFNAGFTSVEMLMASAIAAVVVGIAALTAYAVSAAPRQYAQVVAVTLPNGAIANFYPGQTGTSMGTVVMPNFDAIARAEALREMFNADIAQSVAVFCLARNTGNYNTIRPGSIPSAPAGTVLDTPDAFRAYLGTLYTAAPTTFVSFRNYPSSAPCFSIFMLGYSNNRAAMPLIALYDFDIVSAKDPNNPLTTLGNYVALRRYVNGSLTSYFDGIYRLSGDGTDSWFPPIVSFERQNRKAVVEGATSIDRFKIAEEKPFYLVFWPDPARDSLRLPTGNATSNLNPSFAAGDPRKAYNHMAGRTSFMFAVPMFPSS